MVNFLWENITSWFDEFFKKEIVKIKLNYSQKIFKEEISWNQHTKKYKSWKKSTGMFQLYLSILSFFKQWPIIIQIISGLNLVILGLKINVWYGMNYEVDWNRALGYKKIRLWFDLKLYVRFYKSLQQDKISQAMHF